MPYTFPTNPANTTNLDAGTKSPAAARPDLLAALQNLNTLLLGLGVAGGFPVIDANGQVVFGASFLAGIMNGNSRITLSSTAYLEFNRATNALEYWLNGSKTASVPFSAPFDYNSLVNVPPGINSECDCILSFLAGDPWMSTDTTGATNVYVLPYGGNRMSLWDATAGLWKTIAFTSANIALAGKAAGSVHSIFGYLNAGALAVETVQWADAQTMSPLGMADGVAVKNGDKTRRYLGAVAIDTTGTSAWVTNNGQHSGNPAATGGKVAKLLLYSHYNKRKVTLYSSDSTSSWSYGTAAWRKVNAQTSNYHLILYANPWGWATSPGSFFRCRYISELNFYGGSGYKGGIGVGAENVDGTSSGIQGAIYGMIPSAGAIYGSGQNPSETQTLQSVFEDYPWTGLKRYFPMEWGWLTGYGNGGILGTSSLGNVFITEVLA